MFQEYFGIPEDPFSITPDTKYLYLSERHRIAYAHLLFGVAEGGGFVQLTGEIGTGKTLLCRNLLAELPQKVDVALIFNPRQTPIELAASLCDELHIDYPQGCTSIKVIVDLLNASLLQRHRAGRRTVLIIDEAQNLSFEALEQVRLLTNLETAKEKLLQIILVGQPELRTLLARPELRQLAQRITARYHLTPLTADETKTYVLHRLEVVGFGRPLFTAGALRLLYHLTGGVPRLINVICSRAMLAAYGAKRTKISRAMLKSVAREVQGREGDHPVKGHWVWAGSVAIAVLVGVFFMRDPIQRQLDGFRQAPGLAADTALPSPIPTLSQTPSSERLPPPGTEPPLRSPVTGQQPGSQMQSTAVPTGSATQSGEVSVVSAEPESPLTLERLPGDVDNAFATLFAYWETVYPQEGNNLTACERAERVGLSCIFGKGSWEKLEDYNRPAVIELSMDQGERYHVVVTRLDAQSVTLDLGDQRRSFPREEIERLWTGSYIVLWRPPKISRPYLLGEGSVGEDVAWLVAMLDRVEGRPVRPIGVNTRFDQALKERVVRFQQAAGLEADGVAGKQTLMQLNLLINQSSTPVLRRDGA